jgi:uncharacterized protein (DUF1697 family)
VPATRYVALLRGINVGGNNKVPMADLRDLFEHAGHTEVASYIQSGQVVFSSTTPAAALEASLERAITERFDLEVPVVVVSHAKLRSVVRKAPEGFGQSPDTFHSDVIFLKKPLTPAKAMEVVRLREGVDQAWSANGVLYFARLSEQRTRSMLGKIIGTPQYKLMTIRSWSTTVKLLSMLDAAAEG